MTTFEKLEAKVRSAPLQSAGIGFVTAWILSRLPVFGLLGLVIRVALVLFKPVLITLGGLKAWDLIQSRRADASQALAENRY